MTRSEHQLAWIWAGLTAATIALAPVWSWAAPHLRPCTFRRVTGIPCPSCGATRGVLALLEGHPIEAVTFNPLVVSAVIGFAVGGLLAPLWSWRIGAIPVLPSPLPRWIRVALVAVIVANWIWVIVSQ